MIFSSMQKMKPTLCFENFLSSCFDTSDIVTAEIRLSNFTRSVVTVLRRDEQN